MQKIEAKFCTYLQKWIKYELSKVFIGSFPWEAKICTGYTFNPNKLTHGQVNALKNCKKIFSYKISDLDRMIKPFDGFTFIHSKYAFVIILFVQSKNFYFIDIDDIPCHSFKEPEAQKIAKFGGVYK